MPRQYCRHAIGPRARRRQGSRLVACRQCCGQGRYRSIPADPVYPVCQSREGINEKKGRTPEFWYFRILGCVPFFRTKILMVTKIFVVPLICVLSVSMVSA